MTDRDGNDSFWGELGGQRAQPAAKEGRLLAQHARCLRCQAIIYRWDKGIPCEDHRTVTGWQDYYRSDQFTADVAAAIAARTAPPKPDLRTEAARQVAESRAARPLI